jgi:hypothetical protein
MARNVNPEILEYGSPTDRQREYIEAIIEHGGIRTAAAALDMDEKTLRQALVKVERRAALQGIAPDYNMVHPVPDTHVAKGVSTYFDDAGKVRGQWVKTSLKHEQYIAAVKEGVEDFLRDIPALPVCPAPHNFQQDIIPWIQIGDAHLGMLAHVAETNDNFDLKIAERELLAGIFQLIDELPACERLVINDLGDFTHYENMSGTTEASGHPLDYDGRFPRMIRVYVRTMRAIVERALTKAVHVDVIVNQGNHSRTNDFWMAELLRNAYEHSGRVHVLDNDGVYIPYRMGNTFVMVHHSDKCPPARLVGVMTNDYREDFGQTEFHYIDMGHVHHHFVSKEYPGVVLESWNHLAPNDKWAHDAGYRSRKSISVVFRSRKFGDLGRRHLPLEEVRDRIQQSMPGIKAPAKKEVFTV